MLNLKIFPSGTGKAKSRKKTLSLIFAPAHFPRDKSVYQTRTSCRQYPNKTKQQNSKQQNMRKNWLTF